MQQFTCLYRLIRLPGAQRYTQERGTHNQCISHNKSVARPAACAHNVARMCAAWHPGFAAHVMAMASSLSAAEPASAAYRFR